MVFFNAYPQFFSAESIELIHYILKGIPVFTSGLGSQHKPKKYVGFLGGFLTKIDQCKVSAWCMMNFPYTFRRDGSVSLRAQLFIWVWSEKLFLSIPKSKTEKTIWCLLFITHLSILISLLYLKLKCSNIFTLYVIIQHYTIVNIRFLYKLLSILTRQSKSIISW